MVKPQKRSKSFLGLFIFLMTGNHDNEGVGIIRFITRKGSFLWSSFNFKKILKSVAIAGKIIMKVNGHGQAKILTDNELNALFAHGQLSPRDKALFGVSLFAGARINEACTVIKADCLESKGFRSHLILRKSNTKGKAKTREIPFHPDLMLLIEDHLRAYKAPNVNPYLFPGRGGVFHLSPITASQVLKGACRRVKLIGVSTHSFRRTCLTRMHNAGIPLRHIQAISGHESLAALQKYLEVKDEDKLSAIQSLSFFRKESDL